MNVCLFWCVSGWSELYIVGGDGSNRVERLRVSDEGEVSHLPPGPHLPSKELGLASVVEQDAMLIVTGGRCGGVSQTHVWTLDTKACGATWQEAPRLNTARLGHMSFILDSQVYVACGWDQGNIWLSSVERSKSHPGWRKVKENFPHKVNLTTCIIAVINYLCRMFIEIQTCLASEVTKYCSDL